MLVSLCISRYGDAMYPIDGRCIIGERHYIGDKFNNAAHLFPLIVFDYPGDWFKGRADFRRYGSDVHYSGLCGG
jgi:hypothetical protein